MGLGVVGVRLGAHDCPRIVLVMHSGHICSSSPEYQPNGWPVMACIGVARAMMVG